MTEPMSSAEVAEAKKRCERLGSGGWVETKLVRSLIATIEAKDAEIEAERKRTSRAIEKQQAADIGWEAMSLELEAARMLAKADAAQVQVFMDKRIAADEARDAAVKERDELGGSESNWREYAEKLERDLESERAARQEAERMLAEADCCIAVDWTERKFDELSRFENEATYRHRARQAKAEGKGSGV